MGFESVPLENNESGDETDPLVERLDLVGLYEIEEQGRALVDRIKQLGIYQEDLLYSGFNGARSQQVLETGNYTKVDVIYCLREDALYRAYDKYGVPAHNPFTYADKYDEPAIAVYDSGLLEEKKKSATSYEYVPVEGKGFRDALKAVFLIDFPGPS